MAGVTTTEHIGTAPFVDGSLEVTSSVDAIGSGIAGGQVARYVLLLAVWHRSCWHSPDGPS